LCILSRNRVAASEGGPLGGTIAIDQATSRKTIHGFPNVCRRQYISSGEQLPQGSQVVKTLLHHDIEQPGSQPHARHTILSDCRTYFIQPLCFWRHDGQTTSV